MRKRKSVKKGEESEGSEHGGEPEEFQDSGEDWTPDADPVSSILLLNSTLRKYTKASSETYNAYYLQCFIYLPRIKFSAIFIQGQEICYRLG